MAACVFSADSDSVFAPEHQISLYIFISTERADRKIQRFDFFTLSLGQIFISLQKQSRISLQILDGTNLQLQSEVSMYGFIGPARWFWFWFCTCECVSPVRPSHTSTELLRICERGFAVCSLSATAL